MVGDMSKKIDKSIEDTGERMVPAYHKSKMVYGEHIIRYKAAEPLVRNKTVLDIASGSGYGTSVIATTAKKVYGVDINSDAIEYSRKNYNSSNVEFILGDGNKIPLKDNSVEVVVSFETIEHIKDYEKFMSEIKRVLKIDGLLILSTPNDIEFPETNHFHIHEFEQKELKMLVAKYFKNAKTYYQATWLYNALLDEKMLASEWNEKISTIQAAPIQANRSIYFYMLCSNSKIINSISPIAAISEHWSERSKQSHEASVRQHIEEQGQVIRHLENKVNEQRHNLEKINNQLLNLTNSTIFKIAGKFKIFFK